MFRRSLAFVSMLAVCSCSDGGGQGENPSRDSVAQDIPTVFAGAGSTVHKVLSALEQHPNDVSYSNGMPIVMSSLERQLLTKACQERLGFEIFSPTGKISHAREIKIPVEHTLVNPTVTVSRIRTERGGVQRVGDVFINLPDKSYTYQEQRKLGGNYPVRGTCVGSEYIIAP